MSKAERKTKRVVEKVKAEYGINVLTSGSKHILVCNAGLTTGASREDLADVFIRQTLTNPAEIHMVKGKSFSFISFLRDTEAKEALEKVHGHIGIGDGNSPLYLVFVEAIPSPIAKASTKSEMVLPPGLELVENFITEEEETKLIESANFDASSSSLKHRKVVHFGYDFKYGSNSIDHEKPNGRDFPSFWKTILFDKALECGWIRKLPNQCTANMYEPGQGIPAHIDNHECCDETIWSVSLGSDIVMNFVSPDGIETPVFLPRRSAMFMSQESRYIYTHGIVPRASDVISRPEGGLTLVRRSTRVSLTFRSLMDGKPCQCQFPFFCDSRKKSEVDEGSAQNLENLHVHAVYDDIASHFSETRHKPWPQVVDFVSSLPINAVLVDVGCGNGKYLGQHDGQLQIACDRSNSLVSICSQRGFNGVRADCLDLPFKSDCADGVICIAVIHHLATDERRMRAIKEMYRILRPGGRCLIYAWAKDQKKDETPSSYLKYGKKKDEGVSNPQGPIDGVDPLFKLPVHQNRTNFKHSDLLVPWKMKGEEPKTYHRFYHVFESGELERLIQKAIKEEEKEIEESLIERSYYDQGNWCVVFRKRFEPTH